MTTTTRRKSYPVTEALRTYVHRLMDERGWRIAHVAGNSSGSVSTTTVHALIRGERSTIFYRSLEALSKTFEVPLSELIDLVERTGTPWTMPSDFDVIPTDVRRETERYLRLLWRTGGLLPRNP